MAKEIYLHRYSLIIKKLEKAPSTFEQIRTYLETHSEIEDKELVISKRTFQRDIKDIYSQLGYEIENEKKGERRYFIKMRPQSEEETQRLLDAYEMANLIKVSRSFSGQIFFESRISKGIEHFYSLLHAIRNKKITSFEHCKYWEDVLRKYTVHPLALKEAKGRWYLIAVDIQNDKIKTFGLDRISELEISKSAFRKTYDYNVTEMFIHSFGIMNDKTPEVIQLSFSYEQGQYVKAYPLHASQRIVSEEDSVVVELYLRPTYDFIMELLSYGEVMTVLSPLSLAKKIKVISGHVEKKYCR